MKLNFEKIKEIEDSYSGNPIAISTLQLMIDTVMYHTELPGVNNNSVYYLAINTLTELGIIETEIPAKEVKQINS